MIVHGETSWDDSDSDRKQTNTKDLFLRLNSGSNEMRIVTNPHKYLVHKIKKNPDDPKDFGQKVSCSAINGSCPACNLGDKAKQRWLIGVISRPTGAYKVLDISYAVHSQIKKLSQNKNWGDPQKYDIDVIVDEKGGPVGFYTVQPCSKEPLSAQDQKTKDEADVGELKRRSDPPTADFVEKRIEKILGDKYVKSAAPVSKTKPAAEVVMTDDSSSDFPDYESA